MNYQGMLSQSQNLHRRTPHATQCVQSGDPQVHPTYRGAQDTDSSIARTTNSNRFYPNLLSGCADESILAAPETAPGNVCGAPAHAHQFYTDAIHPHAGAHNQAYQCGTEQLQMQMNFVPSTTGESRENLWSWSTKASQGDFLSGFYVDNVNPDGPSEALNCQDRDTSYHGSLLPYNQTHKCHGSLFHSDPSSLASPPVYGAASAVVPPDPFSSLRPITNLVLYPDMGYNSASDIYAVAADTRITGSEVEIGDSVGSPMLNYHRTPSAQLPPLPPAEMTQPMFNGVDHPAGFKVSGNVSLESQQRVWNLSTGHSVPIRAKRSLSDAERAESQMIRWLGGQCKKCKKNKRKCEISHLQARSDVSATSPSARTCSSSESSFVLVSTHKRRKTDQLDVHAQSHSQSLEPPPVDRRQQDTNLESGRSPSRENRSESISSVAAAVGSADIPSSNEPGTTVSSTVDVGFVDFGQDNLAWGTQFAQFIPRRWFSDCFTAESLDLNSPTASPSEHGDLAGH